MLPQKKAIVFLASYAVDWRSCNEYNDITLCFSRLPKLEKALISGLGQSDCESLDHAHHIWLCRIKPNLAHLRQRSYHINRGISAVAPPGIDVPKTVKSPIPIPATTTAGEAAAVSNFSPPSGQASSIPDANGAVAYKHSSPGTAVNNTITNISTDNAIGTIRTINESSLSIDGENAQHFPNDFDMANSDTTEVISNTSKASQQLRRRFIDEEYE
ncbi:hypothetical protein F4680DRAFT_411906 [Xylaria scruposa]|nr:hypothetical protein F4680DRAFT_411906 [Xylaria scruposa]